MAHPIRYSVYIPGESEVLFFETVLDLIWLYAVVVPATPDECLSPSGPFSDSI